MRFPKRGETTQRILDTIKPVAYERAPGPKPQEAVKNCPKCGKLLGRGKAMHIKHCKGDNGNAHSA